MRTNLTGLLVSAVGDVHVDRAEPHSAFALVNEVLSDSDVFFANSESVFGLARPSRLGPIRVHPSNAAGLGRSSVSIAAVANNVTIGGDASDLTATVDALEAAGVTVVGAGSPAVTVRHNGVALGVLAYTCVCPSRSAMTARPVSRADLEAGLGVAALAPGDERSRMRLVEDVGSLCSQVDALMVSFHWGVELVSSTIAAYEGALARAAIDAGADVVFGHHQHILKGVDVYRGRPIVHGAGNFVMDLDLAAIETRMPTDSAPRGEYSLRADAAYPTYPFHPDSRLTTILRFRVCSNGVQDLALVPCVINHDGQPAPLRAGDDRFREWLGYLKRITSEAGLEARFAVDEDGLIRLE